MPDADKAEKMAEPENKFKLPNLALNPLVRVSRCLLQQSTDGAFSLLIDVFGVYLPSKFGISPRFLYEMHSPLHSPSQQSNHNSTSMATTRMTWTSP